MIDYTRDQNGIFTEVLHDGKPIMKGQLNALNKAAKLPYFREVEQPGTYRNPISGVTCELLPLEATVYIFCMNWYIRYERALEKALNGKKVNIKKATGAPIQVYDNMKYLLLALNHEAYYDLLD